MKRDRRIRIRLRRKDREQLERMTHRGRESVRVLKRAQILLKVSEGISVEQAAKQIGMSGPGACRIAKRYRDEGLEKAIVEPSRPGQPRVLTPRQEQEIVAMVCSAAPQGAARWTVKLIRQELQRRDILRKIPGRETVRQVLKHHDLKPWREKNVVYCGSHSRIHRVHGGRSGSLREAV